MSGWEGILDPGEEIQWQGRPSVAPVFTLATLGKSAFGLFFAGFAIVWMLGAAQSGGYFWMFGLIHFSVGLGVMLGGPLLPALKARYTWYTLSNRRAFVATDFPWAGRKLHSYPISAQTSLSLDDGPVGSVLFATEEYRVKGRTRTRRIGFERIPDGGAVYDLMRNIQRADRNEDRA